MITLYKGAVGLALVLLAGLCIFAEAAAQQTGDTSFRFENPDPAFAPGEGPRVCIDKGHYNFHTADGRYKPFADLLRGDGYEVSGLGASFSASTLSGCDLLVIANALADGNDGDWTYPHDSAFLREEIQALLMWVRGGGRLLLFADHAPFAGAARDLGAAFGALMLDLYADGGPGLDQFRISDATLRLHAIQQGRSSVEAVDRLTTFTGQAFQISAGWDPLLVFGAGAVGRFNLQQSFRGSTEDAAPEFPIGGWVHAAARSWDLGRAVFLGEAAMCTAHLAGEQQFPMGMNNPVATQNALFCLNVVRWLTGVL
jgi:hypothetical protein